MRIVLLPSPEGDVIAREDQLGRLEPEFVVGPGGQVFYRHPWDSLPWLAGPDPDRFRAAAVAWNRYCDEAADLREAVRLEAVARLREDLSRIGVLEGLRSLWGSLVEQAENGLL